MPDEKHPKHDPHLPAFVLALLFLVSLWAGAMYFVAASRDDTIDNSRQVAERMTVAVEEQVRRNLRLVETYLGAARLWVEQHPGDDPRKDSGFLAFAAEFRRTSGAGVELGFVSEQGELFALAEAGKPMERLAEAGIARAGLAASGPRLTIGAPIKWQGKVGWGLPIALHLPLNAHNLSVALAVIDLTALESQFDPQRLSPTGAVVLVRADGTILARMPRDERLLGKSMVQGELFRTYLPQRRRDAQIYRTSETDDQIKMLGYSALTDYPVVVMVSATIDEVLATWRGQRNRVIAAATLISAVALLVFLHLLRLLRRLDERRDELQRLARTDSLTGALNHTAFMEVFSHEFARSQRYTQPMAVMMLDIDFFKRINDGYGHAVGDDALRELVATVQQGLRTLDALGRLGGEEFAILLPNTLGESALVLADRLRERVAGIVVRGTHGEEVRFTISIGVTGVTASDETPERMLARADAALYQAKANGRNRVEFAPVDESGRAPVADSAGPRPAAAGGA